MLGLSPALKFYDVFSFDPSESSYIPRPIHALLLIIPMTPTWRASRLLEDACQTEYTGCSPKEPVIWFKQTIGNACGLIGLLHSVLNGSAKEQILPGSTLARIREEVVPLTALDRARVLEDSEELERAHADAAEMGDTTAPGDAEYSGFHFAAFVRGDDGCLYELEGGSGRMGPLNRGFIGDEDLLGEKALPIGIGRLVAMEKESGDYRFSCTALAG